MDLELHYVVVITHESVIGFPPSEKTYKFDSYNLAERSMHEMLRKEVGARGRIEYTYEQKR